MRTSICYPWLVAPTMLLLVACSSSPDAQPIPEPGQDAGEDSSDPVDAQPEASSEAAPDAATDGPVSEMSAERWGGQLWGPARAVRRIGRTLWIGTSGVEDPYSQDATVRAGLGRLDIDTGEFRLFAAELPEFDYGADPNSMLAGTGPVSTASVVQDGNRQLVVARNGVLVLEQDTFTLHTLEPVAGQTAAPIALVVDRAGGRNRVWVTTNLGLLRLNADTFALEKAYSESDLGWAQTGSIALDSSTGAVYAAVYEDGPGSKVVRVDDTGIIELLPGEDGVPSGSVTDLVWDTNHQRAFISLASWAAESGGIVTWDGTMAEPFVLEGPLGQAAHGKAGPFGASVLAFDPDDNVLIVGGRLRSASGSLKGGGIAWIHVEDRTVAGVSWDDKPLPGDHVTSLAYDPITRRTFAALMFPCNELKLGNAGVVALTFDDGGKLHVERPILSGVRAVATTDNKVFLGLRDDQPGMACMMGTSIQTGLVELHANRSGEVVPLHSPQGDNQILATAGPTAIAALSPTNMALGTWRDGTAIGDPRYAWGYNQAIDFGVSLYTFDTAWVGDKQLWLAGDASHDTGDPPILADRGPRGAALLQVDSGGQVTSYRQYVRKADQDDQVEGLPSSSIRAVVVAPDGTSYLICATERLGLSAFDRAEGEPFLEEGQPRLGGIVHVLSDGTFETITTSEQTPDPRAAVLDTNGDLVVLDAEKGLLRVKGQTVEAMSLPAQLAGATIPHGLWSSNDDLAALFDTGAVVSLSGTTKVFSDVGHAWRATTRASGVVLVGTDEGLLRIRAAGASDIAEAAPVTGYLPDFVVDGAPASPPDAGTDGGACLALDVTCQGQTTPCCPGLVCGGSGFVKACVPE